MLRTCMGLDLQNRQFVKNAIKVVFNHHCDDL